MDQLMPQQPDLMINISASPFDYDHEEDRRGGSPGECTQIQTAHVLLQCRGFQTEIVFDGGSVVYDAEGNLTHQLKIFEEDF